MEKQPTRRSVMAVIEQLRNGLVERHYVAQWAFSIIDDPDIKLQDQTLWKVIQRLGAIDLPTSDRDYLYGNDDLDDWLNLLKS